MNNQVSLYYFTERNKLNQIIAENMIDISMLQEGFGKFEEKAVFCFIKAYEICDEMSRSQPTIWKIPDYLKMAIYPMANTDLVTIIQAVTLSIVYIYTEHFPQGWRDVFKAFTDKVIDTIHGMYLKGGEGRLLFDSYIPADIRQTACANAFRILHRKTGIEIDLNLNDFYLPDFIRKPDEDVAQKRVAELVKKAIDEIPVTYTEVKGHTLHIDTIPKKEFDARMKNNPNGAPDKLDLEDIEKETVDSWFEDNKEQESNLVNNNNITKHEKENADLKNQLALQSESRNDDENQKNVKQQLAEKEAIIKEMQSIIDDYSARFDPKDLKKKIVCAMTGKQHIIFVLAVLASHDRLPNSRKSMSFLMSFISSRNESTMEDYLGDAISKEECETLAKVFENEKQPFLAKIIRELPYKLERDKIDKNRAKPLKKHND